MVLGVSWKALGSLLGGPSTGRLQLEDRESVRRHVLWPCGSRDASHALVLDAPLLLKQRDLGAQDVAFRREAYSRDAAVGAPALGRR